MTSAEDAAAQNMGLTELPPRELRYEVAHEFVDAALALWRSWEPGAVVRDRERGIYADFTKVKPVNFVGRYYRTRGPLNTIPSPQVVPTLFQAGASPKGRDFAREIRRCGRWRRPRHSGHEGAPERYPPPRRNLWTRSRRYQDPVPGGRRS